MSQAIHRVRIIILIKSAGEMTSYPEKGPSPDLIRKMEQPRAQTSLAGIAFKPTATSGARNSTGVPSICSGGNKIRKEWSKSISLTSLIITLSLEERKSSDFTI
jgi:hypothetical protein